MKRKLLAQGNTSTRTRIETKSIRVYLNLIVETQGNTSTRTRIETLFRYC